MKLFSDQFDTPIGPFFFVADEEGLLRAAGFTAQHARMQKYMHTMEFIPKPNPSGLTRTLRAYFAGDIRDLNELPVRMQGTAFQREVWSALREIPFGETVSYGELARRIGRPSAARAVGLANGANPIGVIVPCHRVIGSDGSLTGYGGGIDRKQWLLAHERARICWSQLRNVAETSIFNTVHLTH